MGIGTPSLNLPQVDSNQNQKELTINTALDQLDMALTAEGLMDMSALSAATMAVEEFQSAMIFAPIGATGDHSITFPNIPRALFIVGNRSGYNTTVIAGAASYVVANNSYGLFTNDGPTGAGLVRIDDHLSGGGGGTASISIDVSAGNTTIDADTLAKYGLFELTGTPAADLTFLVPQIRKAMLVVFNATNKVVTVSDGLPLTGLVAPQEAALFTNANADNGLTKIAGPSSQTLSVSVAGKPSAGMQIPIMFTRSMILQAGLPSSSCRCITLPTSDMTFTFSKYTGSTVTPLGSVTFTAANGSSVDFPSDVTFTLYDMLIITAPATQDPTGAGIGLSFVFKLF